MAFQLEGLITPMTAAEVRTSIYNVLSILGVTTTAWKPWSVLRAIITASSIVLAGLSSVVAVIARSGFLSLSEGEWAKWNAFENYGVEHRAATFATTTVTIDNASGALYDLDPGDFVVRNSVTGKLYYNTEAVTINPVSTGTECDVSAYEAGTGSSALAGEISEVVAGYTDVTVTNASAAIGVDDEPIPDLVTRARESTGALSPNGPRDAYAYLAKSAVRTDGSAIGVNRVGHVPDGEGGLDLYLAVPGGEVPGSDVTEIDEYLQRTAAPLCVTLRTHSADAAAMNVTYTAWIPQATGLTDDDVTAAVETALVAYTPQQPIGGHLIGVSRGIWASDLSAEIRNAKRNGQSMQIFRVDVTLPSGFFAMTSNQVMTLGTVSGTIIQVA